jgi:hypothetical protein
VDSPVSADSSTRRSVAVARHHVLAGHRHRLAVAPYVDLARQQTAQLRDRTLCPVFLEEREQRVDDDDGGDRHGQLRHVGDQRQGGARPQQERERLHEVRRELARRRRSLLLLDRVGPDLRQPALGLCG